MKNLNLSESQLRLIAAEIYNYVKDADTDSVDFYDLIAGEFVFTGDCDLEWENEDCSFSHEFGTEYCTDYNLIGVSEIYIEEIVWVDEDDESHPFALTSEQYSEIEKYVNEYFK